MALALGSCAGPSYAPDIAPEYIVTRDRTPLYRYGPQQVGPPEARLPKDDRVRMLRREFGFSLVQVASGMTGYVANEDLAPAPPVPLLPPPVESSPSRHSAPEPPLPPVEPPLPRPDLEEPPADAPVAPTP